MGVSIVIGDTPKTLDGLQQERENPIYNIYKRMTGGTPIETETAMAGVPWRSGKPVMGSGNSLSILGFKKPPPAAEGDNKTS